MFTLRRMFLPLFASFTLACSSAPTGPVSVFDTTTAISPSVGALTACGGLFTSMITAGAQVTMLTASLALATKQSNAPLMTSLKKQLALAVVSLTNATQAYYACVNTPGTGTGGGGGFNCTWVNHPPVYNGAGVLVSEGYGEWVCP